MYGISNHCSRAAHKILRDTFLISVHISFYQIFGFPSKGQSTGLKLLSTKFLYFYTRQKTQRAGQIMKHKLMGPRQTAAFWIEHVLQFGAEHLKLSSMDLTWWQFYCLDTLGVIALALILSLMSIYSPFKLCLRLLLNKISTSSRQKKE